MRTAIINDRTVELDGPNAHPFRCIICSNCYREHRHAARCCKSGSEDLRVQKIRRYDALYEAGKVVEDNEKWKATMREYHYECSCGESFKSIEAAIECRKCRTYAEEGYCTEVIDRNTGEMVWSIRAELELDKDVGQWDQHQDETPLTHNPFAALGKLFK